MITFDGNDLGPDINEEAAKWIEPAIAAHSAIALKQCSGSEWTGWYNWPEEHGFRVLADVTSYKSQKAPFYDLVLVIGIGGSYLGARAVTDALAHEYALGLSGDKPNIAYLGHHVSETGILDLLDYLDTKQPLVNVISKTGTTTEPGVAFRVVREYLERRFGSEAAARIVVTTDGESGALRQQALTKGYHSFSVPANVGGRFSVLTAVGLLPLALAGYDCEALMNGAAGVFKSLNNVDASHPVIQYAAYRRAAHALDKQMEVLSYNQPKLRNFVEWWKQLFGESEGKDRKGLFPAGLALTTDLHSLGQYMQDGRRNMVETFLEFGQAVVSRSQVERRLRIPSTESDLDGLSYLSGRFVEEINEQAMLATKKAHVSGDVPCATLRMDNLSERTLGALFGFFQVSCGVSGALLDVNPYNQPGVEAYKKKMFELLGKPGY